MHLSVTFILGVISYFIFILFFGGGGGGGWWGGVEENFMNHEANTIVCKIVLPQTRSWHATCIVHEAS